MHLDTLNLCEGLECTSPRFQSTCTSIQNPNKKAKNLLKNLSQEKLLEEFFMTKTQYSQKIFTFISVLKDVQGRNSFDS